MYAYTVIGLAIGGIIALRTGIGGLKGSHKWMYLFKPIPGSGPQGLIYGTIPAGICAILVSGFLLWPNPHSISTLAAVTVIGFTITAITFIIWQPRWLKPWWLIYLEDNYDFVLDILLEEARTTWRADDKNTPNTEAELEAWAKQVLRQ